MKFLCVPCDRPMELLEASGPDRGSMALTFSCPDCGYEFAMLTNPAETQVVSSLGVKIGGGEGEATSKCPFSGMVRDRLGEGDGAELRWTESASARLAGIPEMVRPMAKTGIERYAREQGRAEVDDEVLEQARAFFGM